MKKIIKHLYLGESFEKAIENCFRAKRLCDSIDGLENYKSEVESSALEAMRTARTEKIAFLNSEKEKCIIQTQRLIKQRKIAVANYCKKHSHNYTTIELGASLLSEEAKSIQKCTVCGDEKMTSPLQDTPNNGYKCQLPEDCLINPNYSETGMSIKEMDEALKLIAIKYAYMSGLLEGVCSLFGHEAELSEKDEFFVCQCCGKNISKRQYIESHQTALYHNIVPNNYADNNQDILSSKFRGCYPTSIPDIFLHELEATTKVPTIESIENSKAAAYVKTTHFSGQ